jgi:phage tail sheath protein FI
MSQLLNTNIGPERVQVFPEPIGAVAIPGVATSVTAFLVSTDFSGAPVNVPTSVTDFDTFQNVFGTADNFTYDGFYAVKGFYDNCGTGNTAIIVNVGTSPTAADFIGTASNGKGLRALDPIDTVGLVTAPGLPLSLAYLVDPACIEYTKTVRADFGCTLSTTFSVLAIPKEVNQAQNDQIVVAAATIASITTPIVTLNPVSLTGVTPGMAVNKAGVYKATITAVNPGLNQITLTTTSGLSPGDQVDLVISSAINYVANVVNDPSQAAAWYYNNLNVLDLSSSAPPNSLTTVSPTGHVCGVMARIDANISIGGVSHAPAGIQYAFLSGINGLSLSISERIDGGPLRLNFINRITSFPNQGNIIYGGYTAAGSVGTTADQQLVQVIRAVMFIKGSLELGLRPFIWENFSPDTMTQVVRAIEAFLRANIYLFPAGLPEAQQFQVVPVTPTQTTLDEGLLQVRVLVRPNTAVRFIEVALEYPLPTA